MTPALSTASVISHIDTMAFDIAPLSLFPSRTNALHLSLVQHLEQLDAPLARVVHVCNLLELLQV